MLRDKFGSVFRRHTVLTFCLLAAAPVSCARLPAAESLPAPEDLRAEDGLTLRHRVRVEFPDAAPPLSFDGLLRIASGTGGPFVRVVCLGPMGFTLCDMSITPAGYTTNFLHPALARVPHVEENIALCVARVLSERGAGATGIVIRSERPAYTVYVRTIARNF
ncbi:MAG: hypothetical protein LBC14_02955 [Desulfovibrio sp.]|jgi:hypothetical protein|nr:hypothetical protein [Desulfovibrio sp.]